MKIDIELLEDVIGFKDKGNEQRFLAKPETKAYVSEIIEYLNEHGFNLKCHYSFYNGCFIITD